MAQNPFIYGQVVTGESFTNRQTEKKQLASNFLNGIHTIIIAPRRWGKSSMVEEVTQALVRKKQIRFAKLDLTAVIDENDFFNKYAKAIINATQSKSDEIIEIIKSAFKSIKPQLTIDTVDSQVSIGLGLTGDISEKGFEDILNLPEVIAKRKNIRLVVAIDEFQNLSSFNNPEVFQGQLRSVLQYHKHVSYCFFGSKKHMMQEIFQNKSTPFYHFGDIIHLGKISHEEFSDFLLGKFKSTKKSISGQQVDKILQMADYNPQYVQHLAYKVWEVSGNKVTDADIDTALKAVMAQYEDFFRDQFEDLTRTQKYFVIGLIESDLSIYSQAFIEKYKIGSSANITAIRKALIKRDLVDFSGETPVFQDPIFKLWLAKNYR